MEETSVTQNYKDTLFRMIFKDKENLLGLYNAVNGTDYSNTEDLEITTLENAIYMNYKNDVSFVCGFELMLYEHQSTVNPNMPLRDLFYVARVLQGIVQKQDLYGSALIRIPAPRFVVFYNGQEKQPEQKLFRLSDAYQKKAGEPELELKVMMYNVNFGYNTKLLGACKTLGEYAKYVQRVRENAKKMPLRDAVERAVDMCIKEGVLEEFLRKNRAEAVAVSIFEYNEEEHLKSERELAYRSGCEEGIQRGLKQGEEQFARLSRLLLGERRTEDLLRASEDAEYRKKLYRELKL